MIYEIKISLPLYKIAYAVFFVGMLSLVRGVTFSNEIGVALETPMAILAAVFCADTYTQEIASGRAQIQRLCPMKKRMASVYRRIAIQELFLSGTAVLGYGLFFLLQAPRTAAMEIRQFFVCFAAIAVTIGFWGMLANWLSILFRNMWVGIGICLIVWLVANSSIGDACFGAFNLFSYSFRKIENSGDFS